MSGQNKTALAALRVQERRKPNFRGTTLVAANGGRSCALYREAPGPLY